MALVTFKYDAYGLSQSYIKSPNVSIILSPGGFPDIWSEDRIFQVIKSIAHDQLMEEERRLFYVALARAEEKLYLITEKGNESSFLSEIPDVYTVKTGEPIKPSIEPVRMCPKCYSKVERMWVVCPGCGEGLNS